MKLALVHSEPVVADRRILAEAIGAAFGLDSCPHFVVFAVVVAAAAA